MVKRRNINIVYNYFLQSKCVGQIISSRGLGVYSLLLLAKVQCDIIISSSLIVIIKVHFLNKSQYFDVPATFCFVAGHEKFRSMTSAFYRGAHGIVIVYDVTRMDSFTNIPKWLKELDLQDYNCIVKILIGNKNDLSLERTVPKEMAFKYADSNNIFLCETSAKTGDSVNEAFEHLVSRMLVVFHEDATSTAQSGLHSDLSTCILSGHDKFEEMVGGCSC